jgi:hypothetical protein
VSTDPRPAMLSVWLLFLAGPVIWISHFMAVYLLVEAACATAATQHELLGMHVLSVATLAATAAAVILTVVTSGRAYARWRSATSGGDWLDVTDRNPGLAFAGFLLGVVSIAAICFVGLPAAFLEPC